MNRSDLKTPGAFIRRFVTKSGKKGIIRIIKLDDLDNLLKYANNLIAEDTFVAISGKPLTRRYEETYLKKTIRDIKSGQKIHFIAEIEGHLAGSFEIRILEKRSAHVGQIGIGLAPEYRGSGLGAIAMETLIQAAETAGLKLLTLTCFSKNDRAIGLYRKMGFIKSGEIPGMYRYRNNYETEIIMYKPLII